MVAVGIEEAQRQLDSRAIELAQRAIVMIEGHDRECTREREHLAVALSDIKDALRAMSSRMWGFAGAALATSLVAAGTLLYFILERTGGH